MTAYDEVLAYGIGLCGLPGDGAVGFEEVAVGEQVADVAEFHTLAGAMSAELVKRADDGASHSAVGVVMEHECGYGFVVYREFLPILDDMLYGFVNDLTAVEARCGGVPSGAQCGVGVVRRLDTFVRIAERFGAQGIDVCGVVPGHTQCGYAVQDEDCGPER